MRRQKSLDGFLPRGDAVGAAVGVEAIEDVAVKIEPRGVGVVVVHELLPLRDRNAEGRFLVPRDLLDLRRPSAPA